MRLGKNARGSTAIALVGALALLAVTATVVRAELVASGNLFVTFSGGIRPDALPRDERGPIAVWISGQVRTLSGEKPPSVRRVTIGLNRNGRLETRGLPVCRKAEIDLASSADALAACRSSLVGSGKYRARTTFPEQAQTPAHGKILAFNGRLGGRQVILGHVYGSEPTPSTGIIVFKITHPRKGSFGTVLDGTVPERLSRWGYLKRIRLELHREYTYKGRRLSYLSAPCRAPRGLRRAAFKFAYASMRFDDGRILSSEITRTCRVAGKRGR
jgi:hypothetical protein